MVFSLKLYAYRNIIVLLYGHVIYFVQFGNKNLPTHHGHITDCKLDSVVYAGVCVVI